MTQTFMGMQMSQTWEDIAIWEEFFKVCPIKTFIEIGTGNGGMSVFFALQCYRQGIEFHTVDHQIYVDFNLPLPASLGMKKSFHFVDLFSDGGITLVSELITKSPKPIGIFFDNGNKPKEWKIFSPYTALGDYLAVHDWGMEFFEKDMIGPPVERILTEMSDRRTEDWKAMWFKRVESK